MGLFWDLLQQSQISKQNARTSSVEDRMRAMEEGLLQTNALLEKLIQRLEEKFGEDIDGDGSVG